MKWFVILFTLLLLPVMAGATQQSLGVFKQGEEITLIQSCANCSFVNITSVIHKGNVVLGEVAMSQSNSIFTYQFNDTESIGKYIVSGIGDPDGETSVWVYDLEVTPTGRDMGGDFSIVFFVIGFIALVALTLYLVLYTIAHFALLDFDIVDLAFNWGAYFAIFALYLMQGQFLANDTISEYILLFLKIGAMTNVFFPLIAFIVSFIVTGLRSKKPPQVFRRRW